MDIFTQYIPGFLIVLLRAGIVISLLPLLGSKSVPAQFKIGFAVAFALVLAPVVQFTYTREAIPAIVFREAVFGVVIGGTARLVFLGVETAGQMMSNAMGLSIATVFNPEIGQSTEVSRVYGLIAMLIFLSLDAHHDLITIFVKSYEMLPNEKIDVQNLIVPMLSAGAGMFVIAVKISAPMIVIMLITNLLLGFLYKAAPQMNVFFVGYPVYIFTGFFVMLISVPVFVHVTAGYINAIRDEIARIMAGARS